MSDYKQNIDAISFTIELVDARKLAEEEFVEIYSQREGIYKMES